MAPTAPAGLPFPTRLQPATKAYWAMVQQVAVAASAVGCIALFVWLGSWPLTLVNVGHCAVSGGLRAHPAPQNAWAL